MTSVKKNSASNNEHLDNFFCYIISTSRPPTLVGGMHYRYILRKGEALLMCGSMIPSWNLMKMLLLLPVRNKDDSSYMRI